MAEGYDGLPAYYSQSSDPLTPNLGLSLKGMDPILAANMVILDGATGGTSVFVNSVSVSNPNFNDTTPAAPMGFTNVIWQVSGSNVSAYVSTSGGGTPGGSDTQIQFNDSNAFGGAPDFTYTKASSTVEFPDGATWDAQGVHSFEALATGSGTAVLAVGSAPYDASNPLISAQGAYSGSGDTSIAAATINVQHGNNGSSNVTGTFGLDIIALNVGGGTLDGATGIILTPGGTHYIGVDIEPGDGTGTPISARGGVSFFADGFRFFNFSTGPIQKAGTGSPESVVSAPVSSLWLRTDGAAGTTLYTKITGTGNTGWAALTSNLGTVTSVALTMPAIFSVGGSPIITNGTLAVTLATETANFVWAGPTSGGAATPTFRALVTADLPAGTGTVTSFSAGNLSPLFTTSVATASSTPALTFALTNAAGGTLFGNNATSAGAPAYTIAPVLGIPGTSTGSIALASATASGKFTVTAPASASTPTLTLPTTSNVLAGQLAGDGTIFSASLVVASAAGTLTLPTPSNQAANLVFAGPASGAAAAPTFRSLVAADISGLVAWSSLQNAAGALSLSNGNNATTFNQTSAVTWKWADTQPTIAPSLTLSAAADASGGNTVYTGTITGGGSNAYNGALVTITGFATGVNNGNFTVVASTTTTITVNNASGVNESHVGAIVSTTVINSPLLELDTTYQGSAHTNVVDTWTIQVVMGSLVANPTSQLTFTHAGSTGAASLVIPNGSTTEPSLKFANGPGIYSSSTTNVTADVKANNGSFILANGSTNVLLMGGINNDGSGTLQTRATNTVLQLSSNVSTATTAKTAVTITNGAASNVAMSPTSGTCIGVSIGSGVTDPSIRFSPTSGSATFVALAVNPQVNQTSTASGNYTGLLVNVVETSLKGSANLLLDLQAGVSGGTSQFAISNSGVATKYAATTLVSQGIPSEIVTVDLTAQSAAIGATVLISAPRTGMYRISWSATITTVDGAASVLGGANGFQIIYTSPTDSVVKTTVPGASVTSAANTTGTAVGGCEVIYAKTGTNISYQYGYTSTTPGQMVYELHQKLEAM